MFLIELLYSSGSSYGIHKSSLFCFGNCFQAQVSWMRRKLLDGRERPQLIASASKSLARDLVPRHHVELTMFAFVLFVPQGNVGRDLCRAPCRNVAGDQGCQGQQSADSCQCNWIIWSNVEQESLQWADHRGRNQQT